MTNRGEITPGGRVRIRKFGYNGPPQHGGNPLPGLLRRREGVGDTPGIPSPHSAPIFPTKK